MRKISDMELNWYMTRGIHAALENNTRFAADIEKAIRKFQGNDWGELCDDDKAANDTELNELDGRVLARYKTCIDDIYIILDGDFKTTTVLFCDEY